MPAPETGIRGPVRRHYEALAASGELIPVEDQRALADALDALLVSLKAHVRRRKARALDWLRARGNRTAPPLGIYIWGDVGRGKTLLMDFFYDAAEGSRKRRAHLHAFMADVHDRLENARRRTKTGAARRSKEEDAIAVVAAGIASEVDLLCFDEFSVHDIADAMILGRLFEQLFARGIVVVATSNTMPDNLYAEGLNRPLFLPFIDMLKRRLTVFHLGAPRDFRLGTTGLARRYVVPLGSEAKSILDEHFNHLAGGKSGERTELAHKGRRLVIPRAAAGVARFSFQELCARPLSAADFRKIAAAFHTIILDSVPVLDQTRRNEAKRFINLVDVLYDEKVRLVVSAAAEPDALWAGTVGTESAEFARTASRLVEMQSDLYWEEAAPAAKIKKARAI